MPANDLNLAMGHRLAHFRKSQHFTQSKLASVIGTSQARVSQMEAGLIDLDPQWVVTLLEKFRLNPMFLFGYSKNIYLSEIKEGYKITDKIPKIMAPVLDGVGSEE